MTRDEALSTRGAGAIREPPADATPRGMMLSSPTPRPGAVDGDRLAVTEPVRTGVLAGARDDQREQDLRRLLSRFELLAFDPAADFGAAARIYRRCRRSGVTPRGMIDCMIASVAWRCRAVLLAHDAHLSRVAEEMGIELDPAVPRG